MPQQRFVVLDDWTRFYSRVTALQQLRERGEVVVFETPATDASEVVGRLRDATVAIANRERTQLPGAVLEAAERLELIAQTGRIGPNVDVATATGLGIALTAGGGAPGGQAAVAELGLALLLALVREIPQNDARVRRGDWVAPPTAKLHGQTLGILGLGNIGGWMARLGQALGMSVIAWGPTLTAERAATSQVQYVEFDDLFRRSDVLFVSVRLSDITRGMVGATQLALMKPTSYLINIARGPIVDEAPLVAALQERRLAGAGLNVFDVEPLPADHPLTRLDNVVLTPHIGWGIASNFQVMVENTVAAVVRYLDGDMGGIVNPEALERRRSRV
ncbi:MAG TPA: NAD(P)-dependent oxidoreductase [Chloroflexota bacterium]|nr:NAD(P)-dependent oxidoreductase [Chloroflexota bacterium]